MPKPLGSALLFLTLLSFPLRLLAGGVIQTENLTYPLTGNGKSTVEEANGSIAISSWDRNDVAITATNLKGSFAVDTTYRSGKQRTSGSSSLPA